MTILRPAPRPTLAERPTLLGARRGGGVDRVLIGVVLALCAGGSVLV